MPFSTSVRRALTRTAAIAWVAGLGAGGLALVVAGPAAAAATSFARYVAVTGTDSGGDSLCNVPTRPCRTIQQAVNVSVGGDVIHLGAGTFDESVFVFGKSLSFIGAGQGRTVVTGGSDPDQPGVGSGFSFFSEDTRGSAALSQLSIVGATDDSLVSAVEASLVHVSVDHVTVRRSAFGLLLMNATTAVTSSAISDSAIAIGQSGGSLQVSDSRLSDLVTPGFPAEDGLPAEPDEPGLGVAVFGAGTATISRTTLINAGVGVDGDLSAGGILGAAGPVDISVLDSTISGGALPGVASLGTHLVIDNSTLSGNGGANVVVGSGQATITRSTLTDVRAVSPDELPETGNVLTISQADLQGPDGGVAANAVAGPAPGSLAALSAGLPGRFAAAVRHAQAASAGVRAQFQAQATGTTDTPAATTGSVATTTTGTTLTTGTTDSTDSTDSTGTSAAPTTGTADPTDDPSTDSEPTDPTDLPTIGNPAPVQLPPVDISVQDSVLAAGAKTADCTGAVTDGGYNVSADAGNSCAFAAPHHSLARTAPLLAELADNGGPTRTQLPRSTSPLLDAIPLGTSLCRPGAVDQRGISRPQSDGCDIGAVEAELPPIAISPATLRHGRVGEAYRVAFTATGGAGARYVFEVAPGTVLPGGLALSPAGVLSGTPTKAGRYPVAIGVDDPTIKRYTLVIDPAKVAPAPPTPPPPPSGPVLASTGFAAGDAVLAGLVALLAGAGALAVGRSRRRRDPNAS